METVKMAGPEQSGVNHRREEPAASGDSREGNASPRSRVTKVAVGQQWQAKQNPTFTVRITGKARRDRTWYAQPRSGSQHHISEWLLRRLYVPVERSVPCALAGPRAK